MDGDRLLVLTPVKQAVRHLDRYFACLDRLTYPRELTSFGFLESDSTDGTHERLAELLPGLRERYRRVTLEKRDFDLASLQGADRWAPPFQLPRRIVLAKSRNQLLFRALDDEDWVLWLDVDVVEYPPDVVERMLATGKDIVTPHCVTRY